MFSRIGQFFRHNPERECLTQLHDHSVDEAVGGYTPEGAFVPLEMRVHVFIQKVLSNPTIVNAKDISSLAKIHADSHLTNEERNQIFQVCIKQGLVNVTSPEAREAKERAILAKANNPVMQKQILEVIKNISPSALTEQTILAALALFEGMTEGDGSAISRQLLWIPESERPAILALITPLITNGSSDKERASILDLLYHVDPKKRAYVISLAYPLIQGLLNNQSDVVRFVINFISHTDPKFHNDYFFTILPQVESITDGRYRAYACERIQELIAINRFDVFSSILACMKGLAGPEQPLLLFMIDDLKKIPKSKFSTIIPLAVPLMAEVPSGNLRKTILNTIIALPDDKREAVCSAIAPLLPGIQIGHEWDELFHLVLALPDDRRKALCTAASHLIEKDLCDLQRPNILRAVAALPDERRDVLCVAASLLTKGVGDLQRPNILRAVAALPDDKRDALCSITARLLGKNLFGSERIAILNAVIDIPDDKRDAVCSAALSLFGEKLTGNERIAILNAVKDIPEGKLYAICSAALPLLGENLTGNERIAIFNAVKDIPESKLYAICSAALPLLGTALNGNERIAILNAVKDLPEGKFYAICSAALPLFGTALTGNERIAILNAVKDLPDDKRDAVCSAALPFLVETLNANERIAIINLIKDLPDDKRDAVCSAALPLVKKFSGVNIRLAILMAVRDLPNEEHRTTLSIALYLMEGVTDENQRYVNFKAVTDLPHDKRSSVCSSVLPLLANIAKNNHRLMIFKAIKNLSDEKRAMLSSPLISLIEGGSNASQRICILRALDVIPITQCSLENISTIVTFCKRITNINLLNEIYVMLLLLDPEKIVATITILKNALDANSLPESHILSSLLTDDAALKESSYQYLLRTLATTIDLEKRLPLLEAIVHSREELLLHESNELFQQAVRSLIYSEPGSRLDPKNPYTLYFRLKDLESAVSTVSPPIDTIAGQVRRLHLPALQEEARKVSEAATFARLPREVTPRTLKDLFIALRTRINSLPEAEKAAAYTAIKNKYPSMTRPGETEPLTPLQILDIIEHNFTEDTYLKILLQTKGASTDRVPKDVWEFYRIILFILEQPDTISAGEHLTAKEEALIMMSISIQYCPAGKKEGIALAYGQITGERHTTSALDEQALKTMIYEITRAHLEPMLSEDTAFLREMLEMGETGAIDQLSHQVMFVKNLIAKRIGVPWDLTLDSFSHLIENSLIRKTVDESLSIFFRHFSSKHLVAIVQDKINKTLQDMYSTDHDTQVRGNLLYNALLAYLNNDISCFIYTEDEDTLAMLNFKLTSIGAVKLLTKLGFLEEIPPSS